MAKADTISEEDKPKQRTGKKTDDSATTSESQPDAAPKEKGSGTSQEPSTEAASADESAKAAPPSASSASEAPSQAGAGGLDPALLPAQRGKAGVFGGPKDRGIKPD